MTETPPPPSPLPQSPGSLPPAPRPSRWVRVLLIVSLTVNLLLVGFIAGVIIRGGPPDRYTAFDGANLGLRELVRALPRDQQRAIRRDLARQRADLRAIRMDLRALRGELADAVEADPYDAERVRDVLDRQGIVLDRIQTLGKAAIARRLDAMPPTERKAVAEVIRTPRRNRPDRREPREPRAD